MKGSPVRFRAPAPCSRAVGAHLAAAGGVIVTASHNPSEWNALKFLNARGEFLGAIEGAAVRSRFERGDESSTAGDRLGSERTESSALEWHLERALGLDVLDVA